jgi:putative redox protein
VAAASRIAEGLTERGFGVLRFDFTGLGDSGGEFSNTDFSSNAADLVAAADWLREHHRAPQILVGHSLGGAAALSVAADIPEVAAVATIAAPAEAGHVEAMLSHALEDISAGAAEVELGGRHFTIRREFLDDLRVQRVLDLVASMRAALLVLHAPLDDVVGIDNASEIFLAAKHPKSFVSLDGADHLLSRSADAAYAASMIGAFADRYVKDQSGGQARPEPSAPVVVAETTQGRFLNHVVVGAHHFFADEPESIGGYDAGPSPYDLLGAALGACTSMTLRMYADRKQLPLDRVLVEVGHEKVHAQDSTTSADDSPKAPKIDRFQRVLHLTGLDLTDEDRAALVRIADRCPVHRTLESSAEIVTELAEG